MIKLVHYIDEELFGKKVVVFTDQIETFDAYYDVLRGIFGDEVTGFSESIDRDEAEVNIYRFQSDPDCKILVCDLRRQRQKETFKTVICLLPST